MKANESQEGQRYVMPRRFGERIVGISYGWNYRKEWLLFLLEKGEDRIIKTVMPNEEIRVIEND